EGGAARERMAVRVVRRRAAPRGRRGGRAPLPGDVAPGGRRGSRGLVAGGGGAGPRGAPPAGGARPGPAPRRPRQAARRGGPASHKEAGSEVWVFDLATHRRVQRIPVLNPLASFVGQQLAQTGRERMSHVLRWLLAKTAPNPGAERILVTQDDQPVLVVSGS